VPLQKEGLGGVNERIDHVEGHFRRGEQIANYIEMDDSGVKEKDPRDREPLTRIITLRSLLLICLSFVTVPLVHT
jgi:hypothetical protein